MKKLLTFMLVLSLIVVSAIMSIQVMESVTVAPEDDVGTCQVQDLNIEFHVNLPFVTVALHHDPGDTESPVSVYAQLPVNYSEITCNSKEEREQYRLSFTSTQKKRMSNYFYKNWGLSDRQVTTRHT